MAVPDTHEAFIPCRRSDLVEACLGDGQLSGMEAQQFREFCEVLSAYYHFRFHRTLEAIKDNYAPFNPNADLQPRVEPTPAQRQSMAARLFVDFRAVLDRANYVPISLTSLHRALQEKSLIDLKTQVNFNDFDQVLCYCRGDVYKEIWVRRFWRRTRRVIDIFERVVLLIQFKEAAYFKAKPEKLKNLKFTPGKIYVYLYKNIPKHDIDLLFPNVKTSMTWKDRLLLGIPAIGAGASILLKVMPQLLLIFGIILFVVGAPTLFEDLKANREDVEDIMPVLIATLSLVLALGGFVFKQYSSYKSKKIKFQKKITETLFFNNIANNLAVFQLLVDAAEEEECKEIILVYYHLLTSSTPLTPEQLDHRIEAWMHEKLNAVVNFDLHNTLNTLETIRGQLSKGDAEEARTIETSLLTYSAKGHCCVLPLEAAKAVIDDVWDSAFHYAG